MKFELRPVEDADERLLLDLYASTREPELALTGWTDAQKAEFIQMQFEAQRADYTSRFPDAVHSVVLVDGEEVGRVWIDRRADEIRLLDITVLPLRQRSGIGSSIIEWLQERASADGVVLRHSVHSTNESARRFYSRHGFKDIEDFQTHILMEWVPTEGG